ncbi:efflux RND transporter periplasmic adaptor subunit [Arthrospira platensis BEA 1257B]
MVHKDTLPDIDDDQYPELSLNGDRVKFEDLEEEPEEAVPPQGGSLRNMVIGVVIGIVATLGVLHFSSNNSSEPVTEESPGVEVAPAVSPSATQTVTVAPVEMTTVTRTLDVTGTVEAYDLLPVLPQTSAVQIQQVLVNQGEMVTEGQVMAVLDDSVLRSQIDQANAQVESANSLVRQREANLGQAQAGLAQAQASLLEAESLLTQNQARLAEAKANLDQARREVERYEDLSSQGVVSRQELETRITTAKTAEEGVRVAEANISSARATISSARANIGSAEANVESAESNIRSAEAEVRSAQARVRQLETQREQTIVRAPMSGIVAQRTARVGDVTGNQQLFSIIAENQLELHAKVPETQLSQVRIGAAVTVTSDADQNLQVRGVVREIAPLIDPQSRQATVKIDLPPLGAIRDSFLRPGMFLRAAITTTTVQGMKVPARAIVPQADGSSIVYRLLPDDTVEARTVEVGNVIAVIPGDLSQASIEIIQGLNVGDRIAIAGASYLKDGDKVNVVSR